MRELGRFLISIVNSLRFFILKKLEYMHCFYLPITICFKDSGFIMYYVSPNLLIKMTERGTYTGVVVFHE